MKKSISFTIACWVFLSMLYMHWLMPLLMGGDTGDDSSLDVGLVGIARIVCLGVIIVVLLDHLNRFSFIFRYERNLSLLILSFLFIIFLQIFWVDDTFSHVQGSVKYLFFFGFIVISWYGAIIHSDQSIRILLTICFFLFLSVLVFYPYLIIKSGDDLITRLMSEDGSRIHFLLLAGNEDAHFMTTLAMLAFVKIRRYKVWCIILACVFYIALIYNGTRSALMVSFILPILFYILLKRKFVTSAIVVGLVVLLTLPYLATFIESKFDRDLTAFEKIEKIEEGDAVGGNLGYRIAKLWIPSVKYTLTHSPIIGLGGNANKKSNTPSISDNPHNFFVWTFVNWGLLGLMLIVSIIGISIRYVWKAYLQEKNKEDSLISIALLCAWIEFISWSNIANSQNINGWSTLCILIVFSVAVKYKHFSRDLISTYESSHHKHA